MRKKRRYNLSPNGRIQLRANAMSGVRKWSNMSHSERVRRYNKRNHIWGFNRNRLGKSSTATKNKTKDRIRVVRNRPKNKKRGFKL